MTDYSSEKVAALIAEARNRGDALRTLFPNDGDIRDDARLYETLADALEVVTADRDELRDDIEYRRSLKLYADALEVVVNERDRALAVIAEAKKYILDDTSLDLSDMMPGRIILDILSRITDKEQNK